MSRFQHQSPHLAHSFFESATPVSAWLAGLLAADGNIRSDLGAWSLSQSGDHGRVLVQQVAQMIGYGLPVSTSKTQGADSHSISVTSRQMVADLVAYYQVTPRKTTTLQWPRPAEAAAFLRGYIDGDGCVGTYAAGSTANMLQISLVGTAEFVDGAVGAVPAVGRLQRIERCENLTDLRWNGRHAWAAGQWIYQHGEQLPVSAKATRFQQYRELLDSDPPAWFVYEKRRTWVLELLATGVAPMQVAEQTGEQFQTVYAWRKRIAEVPA